MLNEDSLLTSLYFMLFLLGIVIILLPVAVLAELLSQNYIASYMHKACILAQHTQKMIQIGKQEKEGAHTPEKKMGLIITILKEIF